MTGIICYSFCCVSCVSTSFFSIWKIVVTIVELLLKLTNIPRWKDFKMAVKSFHLYFTNVCLVCQVFFFLKINLLLEEKKLGCIWTFPSFFVFSYKYYLNFIIIRMINLFYLKFCKLSSFIYWVTKKLLM